MHRKYPRVSPERWEDPLIRRKVTRHLYLGITRLRRLRTEGNILGVSVTDRFSDDEEYKADLKEFEGFVRMCDTDSMFLKAARQFNAAQEQTVEQFQTVAYQYPEVWYAGE